MTDYLGTCARTYSSSHICASFIINNYFVFKSIIQICAYVANHLLLKAYKSLIITGFRQYKIDNNDPHTFLNCCYIFECGVSGINTVTPMALTLCHL